YHGTVDETLVTVVDGKMITDPYGGSSYGIGALPDPELRTRVVEFNDLEALEQALSPRDVACVITEPVLAQMSVYPPDPGFHEGLRELTRRFDTLLIIDETHNIVAGAGGFTRLWNLEPDIFVLGKGIASGIPASVMGLSQEVADQALPLFEKNFVQGIGTTLSGNALAVAALRATLEHVMTESAYDRMISGAERIADGMEKVIRAADLPWRVDCLGCRVVLRFSQAVPRNFAEQRAERRGLQGLAETGMYFHTFYANRGILIPPGFFALISPEVTAEDIEFHDKVFGECVSELVG
ncbi:MAG: aminotransferase class III-fold pyridoxal phosphate-dependent enzyme, partial [Gammaproteobacteria bacterium]|nr:aminotransferase class III-fold pyridoxal phosphate-dependent enzyme [Gammaproteobacteria bacterium]